VEQEAIDGSSAYSPAAFLADVRKGIWRELDSPQVKIDAYRRDLQHAYLDQINTKLNAAQFAGAGRLGGFGFSANSPDEKPLYRAELKSLNAAIGAALAKAPDRETHAHLEAARDEIAKILDPRFAPPSNSNGNAFRVFSDQFDPNDCWPDYAILP
jgi:hypothetical protein